MPPLLRRGLRCHYCGQGSGRRYDGSFRSWKCTNCEAVNYLDANGQITDPPVPATPKQSSPKYGRIAPRSTSPDLSPQGDNIFCKQCLTNQHLVQQNLAEYLPAPNHPEYNKFEQSYEAYKRDLEARYPQVCADCAPRVNERLKATTYAAKADHLRRGLAKRKPSPFAPEWRKWGWQRILVFLGGTLWWASILGQAMWHVLGVLPLAENQKMLRNTAWHDQWICTTSALMFRETQLSCLDATRQTAWQSLYAGLLSFWWNNQLSRKLYSPGRILHGIGGYLITQLISLAIRGASLSALEHTSLLPAGIPENGVHAAVLIFILFTTLLSLTSVKLSEPRRPNLTDHHPVQVESSGANSSTRRHKPMPRVINNTVKSSVRFPVSALAKPEATSPYLAPNSPTSDSLFAEPSESEMDWTPTGPSQITQITPKHVSEYRRPEGPNPFATLPPDPIRRPGQPRPFFPASEQRKKNFMSDIRGEIRATTGSPSEDDDDGWVLGKKSKGSFVLNPGSMRDYSAENTATGLESLFNSAFTIKEDPTENLRKAQEEEKKQEKGYVMDGETVRENVMIMRASAILVALLMAALALSVATGWLDLKGLVEGLLYKRETIQEFHEIVEEAIEDVAFE